MSLTPQKKDRIEHLNFAERWLLDGLRVLDPPGGLGIIEVDMSQATVLMERMEAAGTPITPPHLVVRAAALALIRHPDLHKMVAGTRRLIPGRVDICLSVPGDAVITPVVKIEDAATKSLVQIAADVLTGAVEARRQDRRMLALLRKWGWIVPFGILRRMLLRFLLQRFSFRWKASGSFQVTVLPGVDYTVPFLFTAAGALGVGRVGQRVVAIEGRVEIRPMLTLACCIDHKAWNGMNLARFMETVKKILEEEMTETLADSRPAEKSTDTPGARAR